MTARPQVAGVDHFPDWATSDVTGAARVNNVVVPPAAWLLYGWSMLEKPARQFFNWFGRYTSLWLRYLDEKRGATIQKMILHGVPDANMGLPTWNSNEPFGMISVHGGGTCQFDLGIPVGFTLTRVNVKWYNKTDNAQTPAVLLMLYEMNCTNPPSLVAATAPTTGMPLWTNTEPLNATEWDILTSGAISFTPTKGQQLVVSATSHDAGDCCSVHIEMTPPA